MKWFWINLDSSTERRNYIENEFKKYDIDNHVRVSAISGIHGDKKMRENCCHRSHLKAITQFLNTNDDYAIICEDDISLSLKPYWKDSLETIIEKSPKDTGIIMLNVLGSSRTIRQLINHKTELFIEYEKYKMLSSLCYILTRQCAIELMNKYNEIDYSTLTNPDCFKTGIYFNVNNYTNYKTYIYKFLPIIQRENNDSIIGHYDFFMSSSREYIMRYIFLNIIEEYKNKI